MVEVKFKPKGSTASLALEVFNAALADPEGAAYVTDGDFNYTFAIKQLDADAYELKEALVEDGTIIVTTDAEPGTSGEIQGLIQYRLDIVGIED